MIVSLQRYLHIFRNLTTINNQLNMNPKTTTGNKKSTKIVVSILSLCLLCILGSITYKHFFSISPTEKAKNIVIDDIQASLICPKSFRLISITPPDSAFGVYYFTIKEQARLNDIFIAGSMGACDKMSAALTNASEKAVNVDYEYFKEVAPKYSDASQKILATPKDRSNFSGFKIKTIYSYTTKNGILIKILRYTFLSPAYKIQGKIDIPLPRKEDTTKISK